MTQLLLLKSQMLLKKRFNLIARLFISLVFLCLLPLNSLFAKDILLFKVYDEKTFKDVNLSHYLMSEKLDGVRGLWSSKSMQTRAGNTIKLPSFFTKNFPKFELDGELWIKRASFEEISSLIRQENPDEKLWQKVSYNVFDVPNACEEFKLNPCTLEARLEVLKKYLAKNPNDFIKIIPQTHIKDKNHLEQFYQDIISHKGEGVIIRLNNAPYEKKRSNNAFKLKPFDDTECIVKKHFEGKGKFEGKMGSLLCEAVIEDKKVSFKIGSGFKESDRLNPPPVGAIITFKYNGLTKNGKPKFASFLRVHENSILR
ncbi:DNA ligase [Campylobacter lari]|uniref:DNA ligase n=2 Tax=Campylobacter lari TaxID=201 RepID=A0A6N6BCY5_CAMLA|nr:DNA ligase [Campylobacter lari]EAI4436384.1 DNA ligase [Campylobacter lari]EAI7247548.1 DNA ligase [Campylobacter lari]EAJ0338375.1 DNA ligase [Campylobacter lari]EAJ1270030.1 DNA ligase [Campylobacter lari]